MEIKRTEEKEEEEKEKKDEKEKEKKDEKEEFLFTKKLNKDGHKCTHIYKSTWTQ